jgi:hypothetical protein
MGRQPCLGCHRYLSARPTGFPQVLAESHNPLLPCAGCHQPHDPTPPETPSTCAACHASIARIKSVSHHAPVACEVCHDAPAEHRELPRSHLPSKPFQREFCGTCHAEGATVPARIRDVELGELAAYEIPRIDLGSHGGTLLCWQCHYQHSPEAR